MNDDQRQQLARDVLDGYFSGPDAQLAATATALTGVESARCVLLVEGISDQIALDAIAAQHGQDLTADGIVIVPVGGAHAFSRFLTRLGPKGAGLPLTGLCDAGEADTVRQALAQCGIGNAQDHDELEAIGFFVCEQDLETELIRAAGRTRIEALLESQGDLRAFQTLQRQPAWSKQPFDAQMHRWLRAGSRRNLRYARLLVECIESHQLPRPLTALMATTIHVANEA